MSIVDTKPFMLPAALYSIFTHRPLVTGNRVLPTDTADCRRSQYILYRLLSVRVTTVMDERLIGALLDRLTHKCHIIEKPTSHCDLRMN